jgi:hypothetical protein
LGKALFDRMNVVCMKFLEEPVNYLASVLQDELLGRVTRRREIVIADHPTSAAAKNFTLLAETLVAHLPCNDVPEVI